MLLPFNKAGYTEGVHLSLINYQAFIEQHKEATTHFCMGRRMISEPLRKMIRDTLTFL